MSFSQALSGLNAQAENIKVISNNIANSQTVGFKNGRVSFSDIFAGGSQVGLGARVAGITQDFRSGGLELTGRNLDLAIAGQGFYRLENANGGTVYSRNGQFNQDAEGFLVSPTGQKLTGYVMDENAQKTATNEAYPFSPVIPGGAPEPLRIPSDDMPAKMTSEVTATYNLNAAVIPFGEPGAENFLQEATVIVDPTAGPPPTEAKIDFNFSTSFTAYDSLGNPRTVTTYYTKTNPVALGDPIEWEARIALDGVRLTGNGAADFTLSFTADGKLNYGTRGNPADGNAITVAGAVASETDDAATIPNNANGQVKLTFLANAFNLGGASDLVFDLDLENSTQFNNDSVQNALSQDGYTSGTLTGLEVLEDGAVVRIFTNEQRKEAGQIVLANFVNPEGLRPDGNNAWIQSVNSGEPVLGIGGTGMFGTIEAETLESSNVDLAEQLVNMIVAQRAYQANSSSIGTQDEMLQTVINL